MGSPEALMISPRDNVATLLNDAETGSLVRVRLGNEIRTVKALEGIRFGFKIAVIRIARGGNVIKYGETIGIASSDIEPGQMAHIHNVDGARGRGDLNKGDPR